MGGNKNNYETTSKSTFKRLVSNRKKKKTESHREGIGGHDNKQLMEAISDQTKKLIQRQSDSLSALKNEIVDLTSTGSPTARGSDTNANAVSKENAIYSKPISSPLFRAIKGQQETQGAKDSTKLTPSQRGAKNSPVKVVIAWEEPRRKLVRSLTPRQVS